MPRLCGADIELGNFIAGMEQAGGTGYEASRALLAEIKVLPNRNNGCLYNWWMASFTAPLTGVDSRSGICSAAGDRAFSSHLFTTAENSRARAAPLITDCDLCCTESSDSSIRVGGFYGDRMASVGECCGVERIQITEISWCSGEGGADISGQAEGS